MRQKSEKSLVSRQAVARLNRAVVEALEQRQLMCVDHELLGAPDGWDVGTFPAASSLPSKGSGFQVAASGPSSATVPALSSRPGTSAKLYLDFDGAAAMTWGSFTTSATPRYDTDNNTTNFSASELAAIQNIFNRVAEMFSPFNLDVTTVDPGNLNNGQTLRAMIGGNGSWYGSAGGVAYVGAFTNTAPNTVFVFPKMLANGDVKYTAEAIAHESGHGFGLQHQSKYSGSTKTAEYNSGTAFKAPILGNSYSAARALWWNGQSGISSSSIQDDVAILSNGTNGFGYATDDHGSVYTSATALQIDGMTASGSGVIERLTDNDVFSFSTLTGQVSFTVTPSSYAGMLDARLTILNSSGVAIGSANTTSLSETVTLNVSAGQYFVVVGSNGTAGDLGQYSLEGSVVTSPDYVAAPSSVAGVSFNGAVNLTWTDMSWNETSFVIQRSDDGGDTWSTIATNDANDYTYTDGTVTPGNAYHYRVYATGEVENSNNSAAALVNVTPTTPGGLSLSGISASAMTFNWNDVVGATGYLVERSLNGTTWSSLTTVDGDTSSYTNTGLTAGTRYYYRVRAISAVGNSVVSSAANSYTLTAAPTTLSGTATAGSVTLTWTNVAGETGYRIERSIDGSSWSQIATTAANVASYVNTSLTANTSYQYRVKAINSAGDSISSPTLTKVTLLTAPTIIAATGAGTDTVNLTWTDSSGETGYKIERLSGTAWVLVGSILDADTTSLEVTGLAAGATHSFRIKAINAGGDSLPSVTKAGITAPSLPTVTPVALTTSSIRLTWVNVALNTGYKIERSTDGSSWSQIATVATNIVTYTDTSLDTDTVYYYRVRGYNASGNGLYSVTKSTRTLMDAPTDLAATPASNTRVDLAWDDSTGETGYRIERLSGATWLTVADVAAGVTSYAVNALAGGTTYQFRIRARNAGGLSAPSTAASALTLPSAVAVPVTTVLAHNSIKISWTNVTGNAGYDLERSTDGTNWSQIATPTTNVVTYTDTGLDADTVYYYRVRARNASGNGAYSANKTAQTLLVAPTGLDATPISSARVDLSWDNSSTETGYRIERLSGATWVMVADVAANVTNYSVNALAGGTTYQFRVRARNGGGLSAPSTSAAALTLPAKVAVPVTTALGHNSIKVSWTNVVGNAGYEVQRSTDGTNWTEIATPATNTVTYTDTGLTQDTVYYYRVRGVNASGNGDFSVVGTRRTLLPAPTGLSASADGATQVTVAWDNQAGESGYRLERQSGTSWVLVATLTANTTSRVVTGLAGGTNYNFRVSALSAGGASIATTTSVLTKPAAPTTLSTSAITGGIRLAWTNVNGESGYLIQRSTNGSDWSDLTTLAANVVSYNNTGLSSGTYYYRVIAINASGQSNPSITASRTIA